MAGAQDRSSSNDVTKSSGKGLPTSLTSTSSNEGTKHWAKKHRTFIASSASSMLASASLVHCSINQLLHVANAIKVPVGVGQDTHAIVGRQQMLHWNSVILIEAERHRKPYANARACFKETYATEGLKAFWRGQFF